MSAMSATAPALTEGQRTWRLAALALLSIRIIQGFIYWGGGSRRFIYDPSKLNPDAHTWMANKFQTAMPGALFGTDHLISFMLQHFYLLYAGVILFSAAEFVVGAMLMAGVLTRFAALVSMGFSVLLMAMFGWQGATCIDEWTMAACNLAMGATLLLGGSGVYSIDNVLLRRKPALAAAPWFRWMSGSLPLPQTDVGFRAFGVLSFVLVFDLATYSYYRGSVLTPFHSGPVSPTKHHFSLGDASLLLNGGCVTPTGCEGCSEETVIAILFGPVVLDLRSLIGRGAEDTVTARTPRRSPTIPSPAVCDETVIRALRFRGGSHTARVHTPHREQHRTHPRGL